MSTNYYRCPTEDEMVARKEKLKRLIDVMDISPKSIECEFASISYTSNDWDLENPWSNFVNETLIHLGKRSSGWKFVWDFHENKYYSNKEELFAFIRSGRVVNEYGDEVEVEEFIKMALEWCQPDGHIYNDDYNKKHGNGYHYDERHFSKIIDELVVSSSTDFS